jgi:hypothetical protein
MKIPGIKSQAYLLGLYSRGKNFTLKEAAGDMASISIHGGISNSEVHIMQGPNEDIHYLTIHGLRGDDVTFFVNDLADIERFAQDLLAQTIRLHVEGEGQ